MYLNLHALVLLFSKQQASTQLCCSLLCCFHVRLCFSGAFRRQFSSLLQTGSLSLRHGVSGTTVTHRGDMLIERAPQLEAPHCNNNKVANHL